MRTLAVVMAILVVAAAAAGVAAVPNDESETETSGNGPAAGTGSGGGGGSGSGGGDGTVTGGGDSGTVTGGNVTGGPGPGNPNPREGSPVKEDGTFTIHTEEIDVHEDEGGRICADKKEEDVNKLTIYESTLRNSTIYHDNDDDNDIQIHVDAADVDKVVIWTNGENPAVNALALTGQCAPFDQNMSSTVEAYRLESKTMVADNQTLRAGEGISDDAPEPGGFDFGDVLNNSTGAPVQTPGNVPVNETVDNVSGTVNGAVDNTTDLANGTLNGTADQVEGTAGEATGQVNRTVNGTTDQVDDATNGTTEPVTSPVENATDDTQNVVNDTVQNASQTTGNSTDSVTGAVEGATNDSDGSSSPTPTPTPTPPGPVEPVVQFPSCTEAQVNGTWDRVQIRTHGYGPTGDVVRENLTVGGADGQSLTDSLADGLRTDDTSVVDLADTSLAGDDHVVDAVALGETDDGGFERVVEHPDASSCDADIEPDDTATSTDSDGVTDSGSGDDSSSDGNSSDGDGSSDDGSLLYLVPDPVLVTVT